MAMSGDFLVDLVDVVDFKKLVVEVVRDIEGRIGVILSEIIPELVERIEERYEIGGRYDDYELKVSLPLWWFKIIRLQYGLWKAPSEYYERIFEEIDRRMLPWQDESEEIFDNRFLQVVKEVVEEERRKMLWAPTVEESEQIDKNFEVASERIREIKRKYRWLQEIYR